MMYPYPQTFFHQRPANSYTCHHHPCFESMPPKTNHPSHFAHLPCPNPAEHYYSPGYYSYPHIQPPPHPYYHAPYPPYPDAYPAYFVPPPHYSFDQPQYDYDKARHHCCGCPNHTCHRKDDTSPKIEEIKHEKERVGDSEGLVGPQNYPYPVLWVPPNFMKDKENSNGWVPLDVNSLKASREEGEEKKQLPPPVIWFPGYDKPEEPAKELKEINPAPKAVGEWPSGFKIVPLNLLENVDEDKNPRVVMDEPKSRVRLEEPVEKESRTKTIPVMKLEERSEKKTSMPEKPEEEKAHGNRCIASEKQKEESEVKKASEKKQTSTVKSPKLPPVCLRVDPLPSRKKTNGTSRSPSPPGLKGEGSPRENGQMLEKETREETSKRKDIPITHIKASPSSQGEREQICPDNLAIASSEKPDSMEGKCAEAERTIDVNKRDKENPESENKKGKKEKKSLSELDAALTIQSAFRGFEVRKWQPLEKLRKIARIREQVGSIRKQIESIECSTKQRDAKLRMVVSETIMNLLLQLDTIQGLHPSVREARKSVARELTSLQEKLDSLGNLVNVENEAVKVEENLSDKTSDCGDVCDVISSSAEAKPNAEQESLESCTDAGELAKVEENSKDEATDVELACDASPSVEPTPEPKSMQPAEANGAAEQPCFETEESNRSADESIINTKIPPLVTETTSEEKLDWVAGGDQVGEQPASEENVADSLKERDEGRAHEGEVVETAVEELGKELGEPVLSSIEALVDSELISSDSCNQGGSANLGCMEEVLHLPHVKASPDETALKESLQVISQKCECEKEEEEIAAEASENTNHEPQKPSVQPSEEENSAVNAFVRDEELTLDVEKSAVTTPGEDSIDYDKFSSVELQKDVLTEDEKSMLSLTDGNCQIKMSTEVEDVAGTSTHAEQALGGNEERGTVVENPEMLVTEQGTLSAEAPTVDVLLSAASETSQSGDSISEVAKSLHLKEEMNTVAPDGIQFSGPETTIKQSEAKDVNEDNSVGVTTGDKKLIEENGKLKDMLEKLLEEGKDQLGVINQLSGRVKDLERKLTQKKRVKVRRNRPPKVHSRGMLC